MSQEDAKRQINFKNEALLRSKNTITTSEFVDMTPISRPDEAIGFGAWNGQSSQFNSKMMNESMNATKQVVAATDVTNDRILPSTQMYSLEMGDWEKESFIVANQC